MTETRNRDSLILNSHLRDNTFRAFSVNFSGCRLTTLLTNVSATGGKREKLRLPPTFYKLTCNIKRPDVIEDNCTSIICGKNDYRMIFFLTITLYWNRTFIIYMEHKHHLCIHTSLIRHIKRPEGIMRYFVSLPHYLLI